MVANTPKTRCASWVGLLPGLLLSGVTLSGCGQLPPAEVPEPLRPQMPAVIFDIDGTLTPNVHAIFTARPDAAKAVGAFAAKGYQIVYLSARNPWLQTGLPDWLTENHFPAGALHVPQNLTEHLNPDTFKTQILNRYKQKGWRLAFAYGDSSTDFVAYAAAGIPQEQTYALLREGETTCQAGAWKQCLSSWQELRITAP